MENASNIRVTAFMLYDRNDQRIPLTTHGESLDSFELRYLPWICLLTLDDAKRQRTANYSIRNTRGKNEKNCFHNDPVGHVFCQSKNVRSMA